MLAGMLLAAFGAIAFSGKAIIVKLAYRHGVDATTLIALRMAVALPFFALIALWVRSRPGLAPLQAGDAWKIVALGFLGYYLASFLDFLGLAYITATLERLILYLNPTLVLLITMIAFKRSASGRQMIALAASYLGVVLAFGHDFALAGNAGAGAIALGSTLVFASALIYALYLVGSGELVRRIGPVRLTAYASCVASLCCIAQFALTRPLASALAWPLPVYWLSLANGTVCTVLPVFAVMMAVSRIGAPAASQIGMIGPVSTILLSTVFLGEAMGPWQIAGTALVMVGVFIVSRSGRTAVEPATERTAERNAKGATP